MRTTTLATILAAALLSSSALAQTATTPPAKDTTAATEVKAKGAHWRSSKLIGVKVYNDQNERLGDINEIILDPAGKVMGYVIGVGGFLGMGEHDILVEPAKIKFVNEPVRTSSTTTNTAPTNTRNVSNTNTNTNTTTNTTTTTTTNTAAADRWYPDHGLLSATKDQLKAMPQFKYSATN
ncbi:MAG TPA: PRC-barrel domain-containing protein [Xanthobacteraceae bacterium]|nr:PRC-barrel domain-containing protein [Xanthobacteraceae bacterium]